MKKKQTPALFVPDAADAGQEPTSDATTKENLQRISDMAQVLLEAAANIEHLKTLLQAAEEEHRRIEQEDMPELMREVGLTEIKLEDGTTIKVTPDIRCGISEERKPAAFAWLRKHNFDGIIKSSLAISFGRGEDKRMQEAAAEIRKLGFEPEASESVHYQTLKSFIKERREAAADAPDDVPPSDIFGIVPFDKATVKKPAVAKRRKG